MDENLSHITGVVTVPVTNLEVLRYSMTANRATRTSSIHEFRLQEAERTGGRQWRWKYLRNQFIQKDLEGLYRKYDDKLRETLIFIYIALLVIFSTAHIILVIVGTYADEIQSQSTYLSLAMYILRITIPILFLWKCFYDPLKKKWFWMPVFVTIVITMDLVVTDVVVPIFSYFEGVFLRPAYSTLALLSIYVFLPMRNTYLVMLLGLVVSIVYILIFAFFTYYEDPKIGVVIVSDVLYHIGVNLMGIYFRLMNEIVTRRSFLDRRARVESTVRSKFLEDQEKRLLKSILPAHVVSQVRDDIRNLFLNTQTRSFSQNFRSFKSNRYIQEHDNVSILYADVVNYTKLSTTLAPKQMVELLNDLFGRFDEASEENDVLRIKFLGDCYYCVSGIPNPTRMHAKNCVDVGFEMISIIKDVREKRFAKMDIDMRIGVHSGKILCGLIGIRKWQFDIWSKDVTIANKMESTGEAGKVHITQQTLELILDTTENAKDMYIIEPNYASQNDPFIKSNKLETYLLSQRQKSIISYRRVSVGYNKFTSKVAPRRVENRSSATSVRGNTSVTEENLVEYQQTLKTAHAQMEKEIEEMNKGKDPFHKECRINQFTLMYQDKEKEKEYLLLPDPLFKYYISFCFIILILILTINGLTTNGFTHFHWYTWSVFGLFFLMLTLLQPLVWFYSIWMYYNGIEEPRNRFLRYIYDTSAQIVKSSKIRTAIYCVISLGLAATSVMNVISCTDVEVESTMVYSNCVSSWHVTQCWGLALLLNFLFVRVFFILKWVIATLMTTFYLWVVWEIKASIFAVDATWNIGLDPRISHTLSVLVITFSLFWIDRTTEHRNRLDNLWQHQLKKEQQEIETTLEVNKMLLNNILPTHIVYLYLNLSRSIDDLHCEDYENMAIMFASLTDFKMEIDNDKFMVKILDEVISDFDRLLLTGSSVIKVEKIKVAGWTYMAACGLLDQENSDPISRRNTKIKYNNRYNNNLVLTMVEFAAAMMMQLKNFNRSSFQSFEGLNLRIGVSNGQVAAGIVGSLKPMYDIWGHAVNMASRMDSTGEAGKIQVTENTAKILEKCGVVTNYRGEIFVKGAGYIKTYFVPLDEHFKLIKTETCPHPRRRTEIDYRYSKPRSSTSTNDDPQFTYSPLYEYLKQNSIEHNASDANGHPRGIRYSYDPIDNHSYSSSDYEVYEC